MTPTVTPRTILVCDDQDDIREMVEIYLSKLGYAVQTAANYDEAVAILESDPPDLALLDIRMPGVDGFCVGERIRYRNPSIPIIFMSAFESRFARVYALTIEARAFLQKPLDLEVLKETIESALQQPVEPVENPS